MPNYPTHARWGRIGAAAMGSVVAGTVYFLFLSAILAFAAGIGAAAATFVGSIYPDIDHHTSKPRQKAVRWFQGLVVLAIASLAGLGWTEFVPAIESLTTRLGVGLPVPPEVTGAVLIVLVAIVATGLVDPVIGLVTNRHRGWTHSVPINAVLMALLLGGLWLLLGGLSFERRVTALVVTGTFYIGTLIHLGLDGEIP
ncbi:metal-dependent hydrolase [Halovenus sp. HT40]|uniref:metal-dependent hydrolase n=1 Tax=Halovenus sp. HT40 TaxID=3126691 RepID=UPI00300E7647